MTFLCELLSCPGTEPVSKSASQRFCLAASTCVCEQKALYKDWKRAMSSLVYTSFRRKMIKILAFVVLTQSHYLLYLS